MILLSKGTMLRTVLRIPSGKSVALIVLLTFTHQELPEAADTSGLSLGKEALYDLPTRLFSPKVAKITALLHNVVRITVK